MSQPTAGRGHHVLGDAGAKRGHLVADQCAKSWLDRMVRVPTFSGVPPRIFPSFAAAGLRRSPPPLEPEFCEQPGRGQGGDQSGCKDQAGSRVHSVFAPDKRAEGGELSRLTFQGKGP